jgi:hypothetical protein
MNYDDMNMTQRCNALREAREAGRNSLGSRVPYMADDPRGDAWLSGKRDNDPGFQPAGYAGSEIASSRGCCA